MIDQNPYDYIIYKEGFSERKMQENNGKFWHYELWKDEIIKLADYYLSLQNGPSTNIQHPGFFKVCSNTWSRIIRYFRSYKTI